MRQLTLIPFSWVQRISCVNAFFEPLSNECFVGSMPVLGVHWWDMIFLSSITKRCCAACSSWYMHVNDSMFGLMSIAVYCVTWNDKSFLVLGQETSFSRLTVTPTGVFESTLKISIGTPAFDNQSFGVRMEATSWISCYRWICQNSVSLFFICLKNEIAGGRRLSLFWCS